jgi:2-dehydro-3-deoxyphosphogluconate aldolase/(4S)-4-hydroxy-2-oxoglutarate aldolase
VTGWDPNARLLGIIRYRVAGELDAVLEALIAAAVPLLEVTLDTPGALAAIERSSARGHVIGAGTVLSADDVSRSVEAGARFVVSPGLLPDVVERATLVGVDVVPGAFTPTEILRARSLGATAVKLFPAGVGGPPYVRSLLAPLPDVRLVPTGGVDLGDVAAYLEAGASCVGLGSALVGAAPPSGDEELARIAGRARAAVAAAARP